MLTQEELALQLGISASYLSLLENGKRPATKRVLRCLAGHLDVPAGYFVIHELNLTELAPRHRSLVKALRRELVKPAFERVFAKRRKTIAAASAPKPSDEQTGQPSQ
jgi:transcriptional regulator with XRE-family HTH domain